MPYLDFPVPFNGFYEDYLKSTNTRGIVHLYSKVQPTEDGELPPVGLSDKEIFETTLEKAEYEAKLNDIAKNNRSGYILSTGNNVKINDGSKVSGSISAWKYLATTVSLDKLSMSTVLNWNEGGNIIDALKVGFAKGAANMKSGVFEMLNMMDDIISFVANGIGMNPEDETFQDEMKSNAAMRIARRKLISASSAFKNYQGSDTRIGLPNLDFVFPAVDFEKTHLKNAWKLLEKLLPRIVISDTSGSASATNLTKQNNEGVDAGSKVSFKSWMMEEAPNAYVNPGTGFDTSLVQGTFALKIDGYSIFELIPTSITLSTSRLKVLSTDDYKNGPKYLGSFYEGSSSVIGNSKGVRLEDVINCQSSTDVPLVIRISVSFDFARKVTTEDYKNIFFNI